MSRYAEDLTGKRFGRLVVIERAGTQRGTNRSVMALWRVVCDCGTEWVTRGQYLRSGGARSCGCLRRRPRPTRRASVVSYRAMHNRVERERGKAKGHTCVDCLGPAHEWSLDEAQDDDLIDVHPTSGSPLRYSMDVARYVPRCRTDHRAHDARLQESVTT